MSQFPHDRLNKNIFELCLENFGEVKIQRSVQSETKFIDIYFTPKISIPPEAQLGLLSQCVGDRPVAFEPYRNPVDIDDIQACLIKILEVQQELNREKEALDVPQAFMWIITPTIAAHKLEKFHALSDETTWGSGIHLLPEVFQMGIIVVHQLPSTAETLWFRLMGKGKVQQTAMAEIAALPPDHPYRNNALDLLLSYRVELEAKQNIEPEEQALIMQLSPLLLERIAASEQRGELKGYHELVLLLLKKKIGGLSIELEAQVRNLSLIQAENLGEALLDFTQASDLFQWIQSNNLKTFTES
ncbi:MAG: DUF4351 domain-containing protein [Alkalinema sp. CAN_BIN05]|nr:DUF4351 domain-containing protein [Alkalinema sp. CAN_BIN05]